MYVGLHVKYPSLFLKDFNYNLVFSTEFPKYRDAKIHENASSESRVVPCKEPYGKKDGHDEARSHFSQFLERS